MAADRIYIRDDARRGGIVVVDDHDISHAVARVSYFSDAGDFPKVEVELVADKLDVALNQPHTHAELDQHTREALIRLGWTPPQEER